LKGSTFLGAFTRPIADELIKRLPRRPGLDANTLHSAALSAWRGEFRNRVSSIEIDGRKVYGIARQTWAKFDHKVCMAAAQLISFAKQGGLGIRAPYEDVEEWEKIIEHYDLEETIPDSKMMKRKVFLECCVETYEKSLLQCIGRGSPKGASVVDYDDMLLAPLYYKVPFAPRRWVLLDEAQDTNDMRREVAFRMIGHGRWGRLLAVGDPKQSIFGFAGATNNAMAVIQEQLGCVELPLNVTYRCPQRVVELVQELVPDFTAHPDNIEGEIRTIGHEDFFLEHFDPITDVILCRFTRPLAGIAGVLRDRGLKCRVEGQSGKSYLSLVTKWGDVKLKIFRELLDDYEEEKLREYTAADQDSKAASLRDRCGTIRAMMHGLGETKTTRDLARVIEFTFRDDDDNEGPQDYLRLATIHRAKGREWERVFIIGMNRYMPSKYARADWEHEQEENLIYVAESRTKRELVFVDVPEEEPGNSDWWEDEEDRY